MRVPAPRGESLLVWSTEAETARYGGGTLMSIKASGVAQKKKGFALWVRDLREGKVSLTQYPKILHAEYPLGEAFDIANKAQPENDVPKFVVAGHVAPRVEQGAYKITKVAREHSNNKTPVLHLRPKRAARVGPQ